MGHCYGHWHLGSKMCLKKKWKQPGLWDYSMVTGGPGQKPDRKKMTRFVRQWYGHWRVKNNFSLIHFEISPRGAGLDWPTRKSIWNRQNPLNRCPIARKAAWNIWKKNPKVQKRDPKEPKRSLNCFQIIITFPSNFPVTFLYFTKIQKYLPQKKIIRHRYGARDSPVFVISVSSHRAHEMKVRSPLISTVNSTAKLRAPNSSQYSLFWSYRR